NSAVINNEDAATFYTLGKLVYSKGDFLLGGGYQSGADKKTGGHIQNTGGWAAFTAAKIGKVKWDAEYEYRNSQTSPLKSKYYANDDTSALLTNLVYEGERLNLRLRYFQSDKPGFRAIADDYYDPNSPDTYLIDIDSDYNMYDYVRRYGLEAQIAGTEFDFKLNNAFSINGFVYSDLDLGTACTYYNDFQRFSFVNTGITNYKVGITQQVNDKFSIWYGYKEWYAYQYGTKLTYNWGKGLIGNIELGWGKTMLDKESEDDHVIAVAKLQCTF
ncbi:MAG TPA: hypothetical protein VEC37_14690, partial [Bacillota bacterium]|nr:hypothetical protein [Bacillota bacterium]